MKKITLIMLSVIMVFALAACGSAPTEEAKAGDTMSLEDIMTNILDGVNELPASQNVTLSEENFESFAFIAPAKGMEGLASEGLISAIAHSVVLVRVPDGSDANAVAEDIKANANPRKWICVEAEKTNVSVHGNTILLVMSFEDTADAITSNFDALWK